MIVIIMSLYVPIAFGPNTEVYSRKKQHKEYFTYVSSAD